MNDLLISVEKKLLNEKPTKKLTRKRSINKDQWMKNKRKKAHQSGEKYVNSRGKLVEAKTIISKKDCSNCKNQCAEKISKEAQEKIFMEFHRLDTNGKHSFISQTTVCSTSSRDTKRKKKTYSYFLFLKERSYRVCKSFYLSTLAVSQKMIYNVHDKKDETTGIVKIDGRGTHSNHHKVSEEERKSVLAHIQSFPVVDSHYCRAKTNKKYLESGLNIQKMYDLYKEKRIKENKPYVKSSYYRTIFNTKFNIDFHVPKSDRCDRCEEFKVKQNENIEITAEEKKLQGEHLFEKNAMRQEKKSDKLSITTDESKLLVTYDLENVITLPKAEVGSFFYKRKLTLYNLTAMTSTKQGYCSIWTEVMSGRNGNDIASAFISILKKVISDAPFVTDLICWSDSCVPQNRNSHISQAILEFLSQQDQINSITMKYSLAGHSCVQDVDNMHKQIETAMQVSEFYSPVSFLRMLLKVNRHKPYQVIQMQKTDFKEYSNTARLLLYSKVPYTKVSQLKFTKSDLHTIQFKVSHSSSSFQSVYIGRRKTTRNKPQTGLLPVEIMNEESLNNEVKIVQSRKQKTGKELVQAKKDDLKSMLKFMPLVDRQYYLTLGVTEM